MSKYKEGKVLSFDSHSKQLILKVTKESLERVKGDGRVSSKFEIFENNGNEGQAITTEEISDEVEMQWTSMIEPRLVVV
ncbi:Hypothetical predicted protein [Paramuricea clavata]|uniref:Uncharacterized protein n=1 Tax=Paramuricea clavata TaxID=317549 RepID=A0A7D9HVK0_PARCT|nr:Hypothetical predicted protein [Paramuricea clavata]